MQYSSFDKQMEALKLISHQIKDAVRFCLCNIQSQPEGNSKDLVALISKITCFHVTASLGSTKECLCVAVPQHEEKKT